MYTFDTVFSDKITAWQLKEKGNAFLKANTLPKLANFLGKDLEYLKRLTEHPNYTQFYVPKSNGDKRLIETPGKELQKILKRIAIHLNAVYHSILPDCAYGCIPSTADEKHPRNIYTKALQHIKQNWLLHLDLKDFFHNISWKMVYDTFSKAPFSFNDKSARLLAKLAVHENRLPIGASSSPTIANLVCLEMDQKLEKIARKKKWKYTRYIDDLVFSGKKKFTKKHIKTIKKTIKKHGFQVNKDKIGIFRVKDEPMITGLVLKSEKPDVSDNYIKNLEKDIQLYHQLTSERLILTNIFPSHILKRFRNHLVGRLNFVRFIRGGNHKSVLKLKYQLNPKAK